MAKENGMELGFQDLLFCGSGACLVLFLIFSVKIGGESLIKAQSNLSLGDQGYSNEINIMDLSFGKNYKDLKTINFYFQSEVNRNILFNHLDKYGDKYKVEFEYSIGYSKSKSKFTLNMYFTENIISFNFKSLKDNEVILNNQCELIECYGRVIDGQGNFKVVKVNEFKNKRINENLNIHWSKINSSNILKRTIIKTEVKQQSKREL